MAKQTKSFSNVDRLHFDRIRAEVEKEGLHPPAGDSGSFDAPHGFHLSWSYSVSTQVLSLTLDGSIFLMSVAWHSIGGAIDHIIAGNHP